MVTLNGCNHGETTGPADNLDIHARGLWPSEQGIGGRASPPPAPLVGAQRYPFQRAQAPPFPCNPAPPLHSPDGASDAAAA